MKKMVKRKKCEERRTFQHEWTEEFAFVERTGTKISSMKTVKYKATLWQPPCHICIEISSGEQQEDGLQELLNRVQASQQHLRVRTQTSGLLCCLCEEQKALHRRRVGQNINATPARSATSPHINQAMQQHHAAPEVAVMVRSISCTG